MTVFCLRDDGSHKCVAARILSVRLEETSELLHDGTHFREPSFFFFLFAATKLFI
jgi:hypothetical protein